MSAISVIPPFPSPSMANYLPVLLVSVNTNAIPDDNVLTTFPCGQVDYLSHNWQEEDVWKSWRNMTRQKNEITNGLRLENASWRTWWKQRNKLKTISPETLNWLKDSDVTWLYGPLHTAVDWSPPPKPAPVPDSVDSGNPASTQDRLNLHSGPSPSSRHPRPPPTKPILKHRSISELLTSDLPVSPIFSPQESEDETNLTRALVPGHSSSSEAPKRPCLSHTKSDTHITRWGPSRALRKDSPPRVIPPNSSDSSSSRQSTVRASGTVRTSQSQDSNSSASASGSTERTMKKKHISFNTFVEQCIAIDKHPRKGPARREGFDFTDNAGCEYVDNVEQDEEANNGKWDEDDDGYEEDREDNLFDDDDPLWLDAHGGARPRRRHLNGSAIHSDSDSDEGAIEIRPSAYRQSNLATPHSKKKAAPRSQSLSSSSSTTTTTTTTSSTSSSIPPRQRRKSASAAGTIDIPLLLSDPAAAVSAYRPRPSHPSQPDQPYRDRVTIAPIAPTFLKTTGAWEEGFGDEGGVSDDGLWDYGVPRHGVSGRSGDNASRKSRRDVGTKREEEEQGSDGTPVELVYVPPFGSVYRYDGAATYWRRNNSNGKVVEDEEYEEGDEIEDVKSQLTILGPGDETAKNSPVKEIELDLAAALTPPSSLPIEPFSAPLSRPSVPVVIIDSSADSDSTLSESPERSFLGSTNSSSSSTTTPVPVPSSQSLHEHEEERGIERGRSLSISPVGGNESSTRAAMTSSSNGGPLTSRGRSQSCQDLQTFYNTPIATATIQGSSERRGRSGVRGSSSSGAIGSSSGSNRGMNSSRGGSRSGGSVSPNVHLSTSPISSSLSPDGGGSSDGRLGGIGSAYAGGRMGGRERERVERVSSSSSLASSSKGAATYDERRGRDRGRRDVGGSGSGSSSTGSPEERRQRGRSLHGRASLSPQDVLDAEVASTSSSSPVTTGGGVGKGKYKEIGTRVENGGNGDNKIVLPQKMEMDASICSISSEGSTATVVPTSNMIPPPPGISLDVSPTSNRKELEVENEVIEEAESRRKSIPTPANSPWMLTTVSHHEQHISATPILPPPALGSAAVSSVPSQISSENASPPRHHVRAASSLSASIQSPTTPSSKQTAKSPPPIIPSPSHPSLPSTSPSYAPGEVSPSIIFSGLHGRSASRSLERASSGSRERHSTSSSMVNSTTPPSALRKEITPGTMEYERELAEARRGRNNVAGGANTRWREPASIVIDGNREKETIINKAVGMVSSAGAYLKLWPNQGGGAAQ